MIYCRGGKRLEEIKYVKRTIFLLLATIPLSIVGYLFAVYNESLFFLYEWLLTLLILASMILSIIGIVKMKSNLKWISISILAFLVQFSALCLFLGPFTKYGLFSLFYIVTVIAFVVFIMAYRKADKFKWLPIIFTILSATFTLYILLLNNLWGKDLS